MVMAARHVLPVMLTLAVALSGCGTPWFLPEPGTFTGTVKSTTRTSEPAPVENTTRLRDEVWSLTLDADLTTFHFTRTTGDGQRCRFIGLPRENEGLTLQVDVPCDLRPAGQKLGWGQLVPRGDQVVGRFLWEPADALGTTFVTETAAMRPSPESAP